MSDSENVEYLQPGFDPKSLTIPRLRSILVAHNIQYPSSAKKGQLVDLFTEELVPQSRKILAARARAKRSSYGIVDVENSQSATMPFDQADELQPPPSTVRSRRSRSPRKASASVKSEEPEYEEPAPAVVSPSKRKSRASSRQASAAAEDVSTTATRRSHPSDNIPRFKTEDSNEGFFRRTSDVFTADNPFQSGSSPPAREKTPSSDRRRTAGTETLRNTNRPSSRRQTDVPIASMEHDDEGEDDDDEEEAEEHDGSTAYQSLRVPTSTISRQRTKTPELELVEAGEEFTPEEQLELAAEEALHGNAVVPARQTKPTGKSNVGTSLSVLLVTVLAAFAGWYRQEKIAVGYCGVGNTRGSIPDTIVVPEWAHSVLPAEISVPQQVIETLEPQCEACPPHAVCYSDFSVRCEQDFILQPHPLSFGGLVPLPPTCEPDGEKVRRVQAVADKAVEELRERTAKYECGELVGEEGEKVETPAIEEQELKEIINQKRSKKMSNQEFEDLWAAAVGEIKAREEVEVEVEEVPDSGSVPNTYLSSTSLARVPITCAVKRSIRLSLARYRFQLGALIALVLTALYGRSRYLSNRAAAAQVPALVDLVLERLAGQRQLGDEEIDDPWLFLPNLRDDVLRSVHSLSQREAMWQRVRAVVEQNSNVRTSQREGRSGEVGRAWEWIGPTSGTSESGGRRRKSGRVSWIPEVKGKDEDEVRSPETEEKSYLHQKWDEGRPAY